MSDWRCHLSLKILTEDNFSDSALGVGRSNAYRTLKSVIVGVTDLGDDHDPLCGLNRELKFLAGKNILEELELNVTVQVQEDASCRTDFVEWPTFDFLDLWKAKQWSSTFLLKLVIMGCESLF